MSRQSEARLKAYKSAERLNKICHLSHTHFCMAIWCTGRIQLSEPGSRLAKLFYQNDCTYGIGLTCGIGGKASAVTGVSRIKRKLKTHGGYFATTYS